LPTTPLYSAAWTVGFRDLEEGKRENERKGERRKGKQE